MIYVTGDTHGDINRFKSPLIKKLKKKDTLIICGDFGFIWDGSKKERRVLKWLGKRKYNVLFVDGVHENFDELGKYEVEDWCGGKTRKISGKLRQLMRGYIYEIDGKKILAFGGGEGDDEFQNNSVINKPDEVDFNRAINSLETNGYNIDYIVSYEPPTMITEFLSLNNKKIVISENLSYFLDEINNKANYERWFFGRHHLDKLIPPKYFALFNNIINTEHDLLGKK